MVPDSEHREGHLQHVTGGTKVATAGSFATTKVQGVTASGITPFPASRAEELLEATTPLN